MTSIVNNKYRITRRIGGGSFGEIYLGVGPSNEKVAVKFEKHGSRCPQLRHEYKVYREVASCHGFCKVHHYGTQDNYNVMVMDLLGPSLEDLFNRCGRRFSLKTVLQLADQMLERIDTFHSRHLIHRDIKPANFVIGTGDQANIVYCVDFGLSKRYRHPKSLQHIPHRDGRSLTGTPRYASINNHLGIEQSRRDDLESIAYVLVYFLKGSLPWQGLKAKSAHKKYQLILEKKQQVSIAQLCVGCPSQFGEFLAYTRALKFDTKPDIPFLRKMFRDLYHSQGCANSGKVWDWDSAEADTMVGGGGTGDINTSAALVAASQGLSGSNDIGKNLGGFDAGDSRNAVPSGKAREAGEDSAKWVSPGQGPPAGDVRRIMQRVDSAPIDRDYEKTPTTTRSAGNRPYGGDKRPHTAHGGHGNEEDKEHVVAGARAVMQYRYTRGDTGPRVQGQPSAGPRGTEERSGGMARKKGQSGHASRKTADGGRPRSAGTSGDAPTPSNRTTSRGLSGTTHGQSGNNKSSYGTLKNKFLSGPKGKPGFSR
mmetsp:Transcript_24705/g.36415  ORF Transcript_24705/g.36415 Transcript_24705/m.36415 type:complete len:537 (+) Transcript_24705:96-1706(+)